MSDEELKVRRHQKMEDWVEARNSEEIAEHIICLEDDACSCEQRAFENNLCAERLKDGIEEAQSRLLESHPAHHILAVALEAVA